MNLRVINEKTGHEGPSQKQVRVSLEITRLM